MADVKCQITIFLLKSFLGKKYERTCDNIIIKCLGCWIWDYIPEATPHSTRHMGCPKGDIIPYSTTRRLITVNINVIVIRSHVIELVMFYDFLARFVWMKIIIYINMSFKWKSNFYDLSLQIVISEVQLTTSLVNRWQYDALHYGIEKST